MPEPGVIERYLDAIVAHDWDALAACVTEDVVRVGPFGDEYRTRPEYVRFLADLMPTLAGYSMEVHRVAYAGGVGVVELSETVEVDGSPVRTAEGLVFDLDADGLIRRVAIYLRTPERL
jgi:ketosteroid isomerase-like protein